MYQTKNTGIIIVMFSISFLALASGVRSAIKEEFLWLCILGILSAAFFSVGIAFAFEEAFKAYIEYQEAKETKEVKEAKET